MPSTLDLTTINAVQGVIVAAIRNQRIQWEQDSADLASDGRLSSALMLELWGGLPPIPWTGLRGSLR